MYKSDADGQVSARRDVSKRPRSATEPSRSIATREHPLLDLQRAAGNRAVTAMRSAGSLSGLLSGLDTPELEPAAPRFNGSAPVVADDPVAESEADRVADAAVEHLGDRAATTPAVQRAALSPTLRSAIATVAPGLSRSAPAEVRVGAEARRSTDALGARAFSDGRAITVHPGELSDHREANRLMAHEAVHVARHHHGAPGGGRSLVHAKLRGTKAALENQGGGTTSGSLRKLVGKLTNWDKILQSVAAYELLEDAILTGGNPSPQTLNMVKPQMLTQLGRIEAACGAWQEANGGQEARDQTEQARQKTIKTIESGEVPEGGDTRSKASRRQAVTMLLPRVRLEIQDLHSGRWVQGLGLSDSVSTGKGKENSGQINKVQELHYSTESGELSGYFKSEQGFAPKLTGHEAKVGIGPVDPNYGARAVAMYRLDQLLGANVTAKAEFAVHEGALGTVTESAKGKTAADTQWSLTGAQQAQQPGTVSAEDPVLQRAMNKLQILDAVCGQLDRHQGNWLIDADEKTGQVRGVTGIDLDMAFGSQMQGVDQEDSGGSENYLGMPSVVDAEFGRRLLEITESDIRDVLRGLLSESEISATVSRFGRVKAKVQHLADTGKLTATWDAATAFEGRTKQSTMRAGHKTYGSQMSGNAIGDLLDRVKESVKAALEGGGKAPFRDALYRRLLDIPELTRTNIVGVLNYEIGYSALKAPVWAGTVPADQALTVAMELLNDVLGDTTAMARAEIAIQEGGDSGLYVLVSKILAPVVQDKLQQRLARFANPVGARN